MVQNINNLNAVNAQNLTGIKPDYHGNTSYLQQAAQGDSFNGLGLLTLTAGLTGAIIFRKNIGNFVSKHFPKVADFFAKNVKTPITGFLAKNKDNGAVKLLKKGYESFLNFEEKAHNYAADLFKTIKDKWNGVAAPAQETAEGIAKDATKATEKTIAEAMKNTGAKYSVLNQNSDFTTSISSGLSNKTKYIIND